MEANLFFSMVGILVAGHILSYLRYKHLLNNWVYSWKEKNTFIQVLYEDIYFRTLEIIVLASKFCSFILAVYLIVKMITQWVIKIL